MAYDEDLAERIRELVLVEADADEKPMFGGLAFLVGGSLAVAASGQGGMLVRVDPGDAPRLLASTGASVAVMRGRPMRGWLRVESEHLHTRRQLSAWVRRGVAAARSAPARPAGRR